MRLDRSFLDRLRAETESRIAWGPGLSAEEIETAERKWSVKFPPDLRFFLKTMTSTSKRFIHWTKSPDAMISERFAWPFDGFCYDLEHNDIWLPEWGPKPETLEAKIEVFKTFYDAAPKLIPIYGHRYIPSAPPKAGNPVFSVYQSDVIYYGASLRNFLECEFLGRDDIDPWPVETWIPFWSDWAEGRYDDPSTRRFRR